ncbi:PIN domain-containing protein [Conexibacter sp. W3-3-2]|uniref:PIN domain nuclease n=1 Tax=Paraconexibacter algicola TaxID=2133960 RepID=A0A2T4UEA4_9ACTN|nr:MULTISPECIES: type II toxin-antitoxin system VapC family toxin [Solirubrobacterales]MTD42943.1 PIN domain-containing protein [Conexibacter sp. W3-3-2]PTL56128.1 PIN domain nuclease [Paraconexibacter algicola]
MKLLLDTHAALWWVSGDDRFGATAERLVLDADAQVLLSAVVMWEVTVKQALGKLTVPPNWSQTLLSGGAHELPITLRHAAKVGDLPEHHRDPFDRLLVAQALTEDATVLSRDPALQAYGAAVAW